jgi:hypothetical protein
VAVLSMVVVYLLATKKPYARTAAIGWNLLGILDFMLALITGVTYIPPFVRQLAAMGASTRYVNYILIIPAYGVLLMSVFHVYSLHQLFSRNTELDRPRLIGHGILCIQRATRTLRPDGAH